MVSPFWSISKKDKKKRLQIVADAKKDNNNLKPATKSAKTPEDTIGLSSLEYVSHLPLGKALSRCLLRNIIP